MNIAEDDNGNELIFAGGTWRPFVDGNVYNESDKSWYPAGGPTPEATPEIGMGESAILGTAQGLSMGFSDEIDAAARSGIGAIGNLANLQSPNFSNQYDTNVQEIRNRIELSKNQNPIAHGVADIGSSIGSGMGVLNKMGRYAPRGWLGNTMAGGAEGLAQGYGRSEKPTPMGLAKDLLLGTAFGLGGHMAGELTGRLLNSRNFKPNAPRIDEAKKLGIQLSPAQRYNDPALHKIEASMHSDPGYSQAFEEMDASNQIRANQILSREWGKQSDVLTQVETGALKRNISNKFNTAKDKGDLIKLDNDWSADIRALGQGYQANLGKRDISDPILKDALDLISEGSITPARYQQFYSGLGKDMEAAGKAGKYHEVKLYSGIREALDNAVDRTTSGLSKEFQEARSLYKVQKLAEKPGVLEVGTGDVSPLSLANQLNRTDKAGYFYGGNEGDLYNLARLSKATRSGIGDSGTGTRNKTMVDYLLSPAKAEIGNMYLAGPFGTALTAQSSGVGRKASLPIATGVTSIQKQIEELEEDLGMQR